MPRPNSPLALIKRHVDFPFDGWKQNFGRFQYFRVRGYKPMVQQLAAALNDEEIDQVKRRIKTFLGPASLSLRGDWQNVLGEHDWDKLREEHIGGCTSGSCRFDKAILAIACLEAAIQALLLPIDIYDHIEILPTVYVLDGFDRGLISDLRHHPGAGRVAGYPSELHRISDQLGYGIPNADGSVDLEYAFTSFLGEVANGWPITLASASLLLGHITACGLGDGVRIRRLNTRLDANVSPRNTGQGKVTKACALFERLFVNWDEARRHIPADVRVRIPYLNDR